MSSGEYTRAVCYVDGGCHPNPGRAGWAALVISPDYTRQVTGIEENSTNQRAEILAAIGALESLEGPAEVEVVSDSQYLVMCGRGEWRRRTNTDLWTRLEAASAPHRVTYTWVRGHAGNPGNEQAHKLAMRAIERGVA